MGSAAGGLAEMSASKRSRSECAQEKREEMRLWLSQAWKASAAGRQGLKGLRASMRHVRREHQRQSPRLDGVNNLKNELPCK